MTSERIYLWIAVGIGIFYAIGALWMLSAKEKHRQKFYGKASWYYAKEPGMTSAMWHVPKGSYLKITNVENNKSIVVRVTDRGPSKRLVKEGRIIDLNRDAFARICNPCQGLCPVIVEKLR